MCVGAFNYQYTLGKCTHTHIKFYSSVIFSDNRATITWIMSKWRKITRKDWLLAPIDTHRYAGNKPRRNSHHQTSGQLKNTLFQNLIPFIYNTNTVISKQVLLFWLFMFCSQLIVMTLEPFETFSFHLSLMWDIVSSSLIYSPYKIDY